MITIRDCARCGHQDYNHDHGRCCNNWCRKHCSPKLAEYGEPRTADTFDRYGRRHEATVRITIWP